VQSGITGGG
jgi:hypothetical protein